MLLFHTLEELHSWREEGFVLEAVKNDLGEGEGLEDLKVILRAEVVEEEVEESLLEVETGLTKRRVESLDEQVDVVWLEVESLDLREWVHVLVAELLQQVEQ